MVRVGEGAACRVRVEKLDEGEDAGAAGRKAVRPGQPDLAHLPVAAEVAAEVGVAGARGKSTHEQPAAVKPHRRRREVGSVMI